MSNDSIIRISEAMKLLGIESIVYLPPSDLVPRDTYNVHLLGSAAIGNGLTVAEAFEDARRGSRRLAA